MPKGGCPKAPQQEELPLSSDMVEKQTGKKDKDKVSLTKTPKLERGDGGKEVRERASKRKLPFTAGANGEQKDSDTGTSPRPLLHSALHRLPGAAQAGRPQSPHLRLCTGTHGSTLHAVQARGSRGGA
ncbi:ankyrin repeat domain-containing protein 11-like isoform X2 [Trachypithecus francoisi]|uniref:ankyrin repeat domain-containing protein 11-like isoform X2 n=1 Tax=Trachypithecus francoisi TaxID=54180 RepID=UPI00141B8847|nr:ankyrin repeat domain-containing protein 11-like isoform X2 [Trachypithecus francoisi]XP_033075274.1 ankyrin repeat domain-containing protein 11-like isoform X2 [Trachypithecus francoisi]XP_033075275.1 ankyrin repeat domain-containing protein 11-like isoform X2 [Trachypithecus francoisi]